MMPTKILPNQSRAFNTPAQAWAWMLNIIQQFGDKIKTEDNQLCKEVMNLQVTVLEPCNPENWPIQDSGWSMTGLNQYADQLLSGENPGFDYTYGERMRCGLAQYDIDRLAREGLMIKILGQEHARDHYGVDQIEKAIKMLKENPTTRRAPIFIWEPSFDLGKPEHVPCMMVIDPLFRNEKLHLTAFFRSHDIGRAWTQNVYGISKLLSYMASQAGMEPGSLTTFSASAHRYEV